MSDVPPASLLITPDKRRRLQQRYEEAARLAARQPCGHAAVHEILAECVRDDPGSTLYLDALLANLRRWEPKAGWFARWFAKSYGQQPAAVEVASTEYSVLSTQYQVLRAAPEQLVRRPKDSQLLRELADAAGACDLDDVELQYLTEARRVSPDDATTLRQLARCLTRQGRFEEAMEPWQAVVQHETDAEAEFALTNLEPAARAAETLDESSLPVAGSLLSKARQLATEGRFAAAEQCLTRAQQASGSDLTILAEREDLRLAHSQERLAVARRRAESDPHPKAQSLVGRMEQEHNRLEIDIFHLRSERHSHDQRLKLELARRLKRAGNYSGAIQRLEEALVDESLAADASLELGECWQHLRQFSKALGYYRNAAEGPSDGDHRATILSALYRIGVLAAAMDEPAEAKAALTRLVAIEPGYKDARERLDKLP